MREFEPQRERIASSDALVGQSSDQFQSERPIMLDTSERPIMLDTPNENAGKMIPAFVTFCGSAVG